MTRPRTRRPTLTAFALLAALALAFAPGAAAQPVEGVQITTPAPGQIYQNGSPVGSPSPVLAAANASVVKGNLDIGVAWQCPQGATSAKVTTEIIKVTVTTNGIKETKVKERTVSGGAQGSGTGLTWGPAKAEDAGEYKIRAVLKCHDRENKEVASYEAWRTVAWSK